MQLDAREVGVGEVLEVRLDAMSSRDQEPRDPQIVVPPSFETRGPRVSSRHQVSISNFNMVTQKGVSATWLLTPSRPGLYTIGPASVALDSDRHSAETAQVRVLPAGQRPKRRTRRRRRDPFDLDPLGQNDPFDDIFERLRRGTQRELPFAPPGLSVDPPPDPLAFVHAQLDRTQAVVGEQVTLTIHAHGSRGMFQEAAGSREPSHSDFLARRLVEDGSRQTVYQRRAAGRRWVVVKVREIALFPLRAGSLEIGPLEFGFLGRSYGARRGMGLRRSSRALSVVVSPPPPEGRPAGYSGEVGRFGLQANVEPRQVPAGGAVSVVATLVGEGRLPGSLKLPEQKGVEWVEPTLRDEEGVTAGRVGGRRTFSYVVRLRDPGTVDLGSLRLPHYDAAAGRYRVAQVALGRVVVTPGAPSQAPGAADASGDGGASGIGGLFAFRSRVAAVEASRHLTDHLAFWLSLMILPGMALASLGARSGLRRWSDRRRRSRHSPATHAIQALRDARRAVQEDRGADAASAIERALYRGVEWATGLRVRAVLRTDLERTLTEAALPDELSRQVVALLDRGSAARFAGPSNGDAALLADAEPIVRALIRRPAATAASAATDDGQEPSS